MASPGIQNCRESRNFLADFASVITSEVSSMMFARGVTLLLVVGRPGLAEGAGSAISGVFLLPGLGGGRPRVDMTLREERQVTEML